MLQIGFDDWSLDSKYPNGHFLRILGPSDDWRTEIECILMKNQIFRRPFSTEVLSFVFMFL